MTITEDGAVPDFLRMDQPVSSDPANAKKTGNWRGWPTKELTPVTLKDNEDRTVTESAAWTVKISGEVKNPLTLNFDQLRRFPARSVRTVLECSGSGWTV